MAEFVTLSAKSDKILPYFGGLFPDEPLPKNGWIDLPDRAGFGVTLCRKGLVRSQERPIEHSQMQAKKNINRAQPTKAHMPF